MDLESYILAGGQTVMYPHEELPANIPDGYYWQPMTFNGSISCYKLFEIPKKSDCNCHK